MIMSDKEWYTLVAEMPPKFQAIAEELWDITGRPNHEQSYVIALGKLLDMSEKISEFKANYQILFPEKDITDWATDIMLNEYWNLYMFGIERCRRAFMERD